MVFWSLMCCRVYTRGIPYAHWQGKRRWQGEPGLAGVRGLRGAAAAKARDGRDAPQHAAAGELRCCGGVSDSQGINSSRMAHKVSEHCTKDFYLLGMSTD